MIQSIGRTLLAAQSWPTMDLAEVARSLAGPFNDDYNQFHSCYQCHGSPLGKVYVNTPWPAVCFDVDNEVMYLKQDLAISHNGWQSAVVPPVNDPVFDNLTHYWSMDEASGTRVDSKGSIDLSEVGGVVSSGTGKDGNAADFTTNSYLKSASDWRPAAPFSVSFWAYLRTLPAASTTLFDLAMTDLGGTDLDLSVVVFSDGSLVFTAVADSNPINTTFGTLNTWHLIVFKSDGVDTSISIDGGNFVTTAEQGDFTAFQSSITNLVTVGLTGNATSPDGLIDEVGTYNVALSQSDVTTLWNGGIGKFYRP